MALCGDWLVLLKLANQPDCALNEEAGQIYFSVFQLFLESLKGDPDL